MKDLSNYNVRNLSNLEVLDINGGEPGSETSFWYDVAWLLGRATRTILDNAGPKPGQIWYY